MTPSPTHPTRRAHDHAPRRVTTPIPTSHNQSIKSIRGKCCCYGASKGRVAPDTFERLGARPWADRSHAIGNSAVRRPIRRRWGWGSSGAA
jgi:hypothetical protein